MREFIKKNKIAVIIVSALLIVVILVACLLPGRRDNEQNQDTGNNVENNIGNEDDEQDSQTGSDEQGGGIIVEDTSGEDNSGEDNSGDESEINKEEPTEPEIDADIGDVVDEIIQENEENIRLTKEEIEAINEAIFLNDEECYWPNMFMGCYYTSPEEIDLGELFYNGLGFGENYEVSEDEIARIEDILGGDYYGSITKLPIDKMDEVINKYTGLSIQDYEKKLEEHFVYLEDYNSCYNFSGDVDYDQHAIEDGYRTPTGELMLLYRDSDEWICSVTVKETEDNGFLFISNVKYGIEGEVSDVRDKIADWEQYSYIVNICGYDKDKRTVSLQTYNAENTSRGPLYADLYKSIVIDLELEADCEIMLLLDFNAMYLSPESLDFLQNRECLTERIFFILVEDGKVVKMIERAVLRTYFY